MVYTCACDVLVNVAAVEVECKIFIGRVDGEPYSNGRSYQEGRREPFQDEPLNAEPLATNSLGELVKELLIACIRAHDGGLSLAGAATGNHIEAVKESSSPVDDHD